MRRFFLILCFLAALAVVLLAMPYVRYRRTAGVVPAWTRLGGVALSAATAPELAAALSRGLEEPVEAYYGSQRILLLPEAVGFRVDVEGMIEEARAYDTAERLVRYLVEESLNRTPLAIDVPLRYSLDAEALSMWLAEVAARYDRPAGQPQPMVATLTIAPGKPGMELDVSTAREQVIRALTDPAERVVHLAVRETPALPIDINALGALLAERLDQFPGIASAYLHYLPTGEEIAINADVAYAGTSTLKIPILAQIYRIMDGPPDPDTAKIISETMALSGNFTANLLLGKLGAGSWDAGVQVMNQAFKSLGMKNTFMATPYDRKLAVAPRVVTEANSRTDLNTRPDPYMQTTPREIGMALQMVVACSQGGGTLIAAYGDRITSAECQQILDFMALNEMKELLVGGLPPGTRAVHKHGYVPDTHGDVAAIWGPAGPYVLALFLYRPTWLEWHISNPTMQEVARATWNYFETAAQE